jgi:putative transcriptional regulator
MPAKDKIPDFRFEDLLASMQQGADHAIGKITARTHRLTARAASMTGEEIAAIRSNLNVSQAVFADLLNVPKATAVAWERGVRSPSGAAVRLLQIARETPEALVGTSGRKK